VDLIQSVLVELNILNLTYLNLFIFMF
jgi:hypothetical protein